MAPIAHRNALQAGHTLHWYRIERVLGQGAFGITYLAHDINLDRQVAIKEYMPSQLSMRENSQSVQPLSEEHREGFKAGLLRFVSEARTLTRFEHANLIRVFNVFEANNTAYMVMNYEVGQSLKDLIKRKQRFTEEQIISIIQPLLSGLQNIHDKGFVHRDIKPGNVFIRSSGSPVLIDFGSARQTLQDNPQTLTNFVSPGYAPIEQYVSKSDKQGPWTDIYGLSATLYRVMAGVVPHNAIERSESIMGDKVDPLMPLSVLVSGQYSEKLLEAIDHGLAFWAHDRPQTVALWREDFGFPPENTGPYIPNQEQTVITDPLQHISLHITSETSTDITESVAPTTAPVKLQTLESEMATAPVIDTTTGNIQETTAVTTEISDRKLNTQLKVTAAAVIVLAGFLYFLLFYRAETETPALMSTGPVPAQHTEAGSEPVLTQQPANEIEKLLTAAQAAMTDLKLTTPAGDNAYERYQQVLTIDPENTEARQGIESISDRYVDLAYRAMDTGDHDRASHYVNKAREIWPESPRIRSASDRLDSMAAQTSTTASETSAEDVFEDIKKWFKESAEKASESEKNRKSNPLDEQIKRSM